MYKYSDGQEVFQGDIVLRKHESMDINYNNEEAIVVGFRGACVLLQFTSPSINRTYPYGSYTEYLTLLRRKDESETSQINTAQLQALFD